jgi:hypothetical protein
MLETGTCTFSKYISAWPCGASSYPNTDSGRTMRTPLVSAGTITMLCCEWRGASGSVLPMVMKTAQRGSAAPEVHHLWPLITYSSPWRSIRVEMLVASADATSGSVIAKAERISPSNRGLSQRALISSEP